MEKPPIGFVAWAPQCPAQWLRRIVFSWHIADARKYPPLLKSHCVPAILLPVPSEHRWPAKARHRYGEDRGNECAVNCSWQATLNFCKYIRRKEFFKRSPCIQAVLKLGQLFLPFFVQRAGMLAYQVLSYYLSILYPTRKTVLM